MRDLEWAGGAGKGSGETGKGLEGAGRACKGLFFPKGLVIN